MYFATIAINKCLNSFQSKFVRGTWLSLPYYFILFPSSLFFWADRLHYQCKSLWMVIMIFFFFFFLLIAREKQRKAETRFTIDTQFKTVEKRNKFMPHDCCYYTVLLCTLDNDWSHVTAAAYHAFCCYWSLHWESYKKPAVRDMKNDKMSVRHSSTIFHGPVV